MSWYVDVSVRAVQRYLARSTEEALQSSRDASDRMVRATNSHHVQAALVHKVPELEVNDEAVATDETVTLRLPEDASRETATRVAELALLEVRSQLPAAQLHAVIGRGANYFEAYQRELGPSLAHGDGIVSPAPLADVLPAHRCGMCSRDHAVGTVRLVGEEPERSVCADCAQRHDPTARRDARREGPSPRLIAQLGGEEVTGAQAKDFEQLAKQGTRNDNHLATIYADANGLGAAFAELLGETSGDDPGGPARELSKIVKEAVHDALREAATPLCRPGGVFPVAAHVVGGDDVMVSVPAEHGLTFARRLASRFAEAVEEGLSQGGDDVARPETPLTMSASVVIAHRSFPFLRCADLAGELLDDAKRLGRGTHARLGWLLVTQEGVDPPRGRNAWSLAALDRHDDDLSRLAARPQHARKQLERAVARSNDEIAAAHASRAVRRAGDLHEVASLLDDAHGVGVQGLRDALSLAQWWPPSEATQTAGAEAPEGAG